MERRKKLNLKVKWELQRWLLWRILLTIVFAISIALVILYFFSHREIGESLYKAHLTIKHVSDLLLPVILASGGVCLLAGLLIAIFLPQKIAGPIYRIEEDLKYVAETGDFTKVIRLRRGDRFDSLVQAANMLIRRVQKEFQELAQGLSEVEEALQKGQMQEAQERIKVLQKRLSQLKTR